MYSPRDAGDAKWILWRTIQVQIKDCILLLWFESQMNPLVSCVPCLFSRWRPYFGGLWKLWAVRAMLVTGVWLNVTSSLVFLFLSLPHVPHEVTSPYRHMFHPSTWGSSNHVPNPWKQWTQLHLPPSKSFSWIFWLQSHRNSYNRTIVSWKGGLFFPGVKASFFMNSPASIDVQGNGRRLANCSLDKKRQLHQCRVQSVCRLSSSSFFIPCSPSHWALTPKLGVPCQKS